jgi:S-phase kinase-associated protein 1
MLSLDCEETLPKITIITNGKEYVLDKKEASLSFLLNTCINNDKDCNEIKLNIEPGTFDYVVEYMKLATESYPSDIPKPIKDLSLRTYLQVWEYDYLSRIESANMIKKVLDLVNYLDVPPLFELLCAKIASVIKHKIHLPNLNEIIENL